MKHVFIILDFFFSFWVALRCIIDDNYFFFRSLINLDSNLKYFSVVDDHDKFLRKQLLLNDGFLFNLVALSNHKVFILVILSLCKLKHVRDNIQVGPRTEAVTCVLELNQSFKWTVAKHQFVQIRFVDLFHNVEFLGSVF